MKRRVGQRLRVTIDRTSVAGNGVTDEEDGGHLNLGPIFEKFVGEEIMVRMVGPHSAEPVDNKYRKDVYAQQNVETTHGFEVGDIISGRPKRCNADGTPVIETEGIRARVPGVELNEFTEVKIESFVETDSQWQVVIGRQIDKNETSPQNVNNQIDQKTTTSPIPAKKKEREFSGLDSEADNSESTESSSNSIDMNSGAANGATDHPDADSSRISEVNPADLSELRSRAEDHASVDPSRSDMGRSGSKYIRSAAVKKYARARSGGDCELCENAAPFQSKTGEPYLEVHHVDELGNGGEDRPDRVVALCPTCHAKIHYGLSGDDLNDQVKKKLETEIEPINS